ncbi:MAG: 16S rRNA (guanine(966)-N(2))-methyltransferase RsmD [Chloroflexota bacterium]|nr:16S rRNA (guanine(966)-N(2))-methyltransferase RsmD [Chloroflexota bacterium]
MRVIAGVARGFPLKGPPGPATRATSDKVRGAIFDALVLYLEDARVLDLYAGTGALGVEALSRGAASCLFVEKAAAACRVIEVNVRATKLADSALVWPMTVERALDRLEKGGVVPPEFNPPYDILTLDPPYGAPGIADVIERVSRPGLVARGGFVVLEHDKRWSPPADPGALRLRRTRLYGDTGVTLWQRDEEAEE